MKRALVYGRLSQETFTRSQSPHILLLLHHDHAPNHQLPELSLYHRLLPLRQALCHHRHINQLHLYHNSPCLYPHHCCTHYSRMHGIIKTVVDAHSMHIVPYLTNSTYTDLWEYHDDNPPLRYTVQPLRSNYLPTLPYPLPPQRSRQVPPTS